MGDTGLRLKRAAGPVGIVSSLLIGLAALLASLQGPRAEERVVQSEVKMQYFEKWLERVENKLDRVIEERRKP